MDSFSVVKTKEDLLSALNKVSAEQFSCWGDLYMRLKEVAAAFTANPNYITASYAVATLVSFVIALEDMPEEGDVVVIAQELNKILVMQPERTGVTIMLTDMREQSGVTLGVSSVVDAPAPPVAEEATAPEATEGKRYLH